MSTGAVVKCRLQSAHDLAALLSTLQLKDKDQKDQRVYCEASARGLKLVAQSGGKDVAVLAWMFENAFQEYQFIGEEDDDIHLKLPLAPLLSCLQIYSDRAALLLQYPSGPADELRFMLEEEGAITECSLRTLVLDEGPAVTAFLGPGDSLSTFRLKQPDAWHLALSEFSELDAPDVVLKVTLHDPASAGCIVLRAQTLTSDAEVELPRETLDELTLCPEAKAAGGGKITHCYPLSSVLAGCLRAAKEAKAVKVRFNREGVMSNQFILRGRGQRDLFSEALVSPLAQFPGAGIAGTQLQTSMMDTLPGAAAAGESLGF